MFKKILEQNNHIFMLYDLENNPFVRIVNCIDTDCEYFFDKRNKKDIDFYIEQACRQYVKENGFKLEWLLRLFDNVHTVSFKNSNLLTINIGIKDTDYIGELGHISLLNNVIADWDTTRILITTNKLIAWLYANDIEIKED